jgi:uncharacterized protein YndB with AHSA1/START domain
LQRAYHSGLRSAKLVVIVQSIEQTVVINAPPWVVWESLTRAERMKEWMGEPEMKIEVETDWEVGGPIVVRGFHHARFKNTGVVLELEAPKRLRYTHLSSLSRLPDKPESYTTFEFRLDPVGDFTSLTLVVTGFPTETIFKHLQFYWSGTLEILKQHAEQHQELAKTLASRADSC